MNEVIQLTVNPKMEAYSYEGQRYILKFEPSATPDERWSWMVEYTVKYNYYGAAPTIDLAGRRARSKIRNLKSRGRDE